ncbi:MAG: MerR family transcriptional regulator [Roseibium sp.]|uniref:MerR family transcriptional regulator n=1 Tax=Roseibium sp. TaxID=1936156 RepID=UPI00261AE98B|nr:MerR family transcriptional regulator [Roseibium sp.]MCV0426062.1 MerR family transcriptional regulator [Roseibium sp.]
MATIGEASRHSGVGIETIRYYEREGIASKPARAANGRRIYTSQEIGELRFIRRCRELGFPLQDVRRLLAISNGNSVNCGEVMQFGRNQLSEVRAKIAELKNLQDALEELTSNCSIGSTKCPMLETLRSV